MKNCSILTSVFINKNVLEYNTVSFCIVYGCFHGTIAELNSCKRDHVAHKAKICTVSLYRNFRPLDLRKKKQIIRDSEEFSKGKGVEMESWRLLGM